MSLAGAISKGLRSRHTQLLLAAGGSAVASAALGATAFARRRLANGKPVHLRAVTTVDRDADEAYRRWRDLPKIPQFMTQLREVATLDATHSRWTAGGAGAAVLRWDVEITHDEPGRSLAWRSLPGAEVPTRGRVTFTPASGTGTEVRVEVEYDRTPGDAGTLLAVVAGADPAHQLRADLRRFKQLVETGIVLREHPAPAAPPLRRLVAQRTGRSE